jgi:hypothetical protein
LRGICCRQAATNRQQAAPLVNVDIAESGSFEHRGQLAGVSIAE